MRMPPGFSPVLKYKVPKGHWEDSSGSTKLDWELKFRRWCRDNLQPGYDVINYHVPVTVWLVTVGDEIDYDLLILTWGK